MERREGRGSRAAPLLLGLLLVAVGVGLLVAQLYGIDLRFDLARFGWPMFVLVPGVALLVFGLILDDGPGVGLAVAGAIVSTIGLILSYQFMTGHWTSWAYAWTLIAPTSVGAGMTLWGLLHLRGRMLRAGLAGLGSGLVLFLLFFGFFEGLIGIGGDRGLAPLGRMALPFALIAAGVLVILARLWPRPTRDRTPPWGSAPAAGEEPRAASASPPVMPADPAAGSAGPAPSVSEPADYGLAAGGAGSNEGRAERDELNDQDETRRSDAAF